MHKRHGFSPWVGKIPRRRAWQPILVLLPREFHGQRSLAGYSPCGHKESDRTEWLTLSLSTFSQAGITCNERCGSPMDTVGKKRMCSSRAFSALHHITALMSTEGWSKSRESTPGHGLGRGARSVLGRLAPVVMMAPGEGPHGP